MTTRVQKGGAVFKPVTKPRNRAIANNPPDVSFPTEHPDFQAENNHIGHAPITVTASTPIVPAPVTAIEASVPESLFPNSHLINESFSSPHQISLNSAGGQPTVQSHPINTAVDPTQMLSVSPDERSNMERAPSAQDRKRRRSKATSLPPFDADANPGDEIDPTSITMAALCNDTGQGRVSSKAAQIQSNHAAWKISNKAKRAKLKSASERKKYGKDPDEENTASNTAGPISPVETQPPNTETVTPPAEDRTGNGFDYNQDLSTNRFTVRVRIGANGETVIDEESLFVDRNMQEDTESYTHVEESDTTKFTNSGTYGRKLRGSRWSTDETEQFYGALSQFGENYELISYVLPGRDRKACKNKFKAEDKRNPNRITYCLNHRVPYDIQTLSRMTGKDFSGPTPQIVVPKVSNLVLPEAEIAKSTGQIDAALRTTPTPDSRRPEEEIIGDLDNFDDETW